MEKPTIEQIGTLFSIGRRNINNLPLLGYALNWLRENASEAQVAMEINRVNKLATESKLDDDTYFDSPIWRDFRVKYEE